MDLIWPLESSYDVDTRHRSIVVMIPRKFPSKWQNNLFLHYYTDESIEIRIDDCLFVSKDGNYTVQKISPHGPSWLIVSREQYVKWFWDHVLAGGLPVDPTALAMIVIVNTLPQPIAEEMTPHLVMSLRVLNTRANK